jgi:hypothetical protein
MEMSSTGAPRLLRKIAFLEGDWNVVMSVKPSPRTDWSETNGKSTFRWILDRTILEQDYDGTMGERTFQGRGYLAFNRFSGKWQHTWADNVAAILSLYEGEFAEGRLIVTGKETTPQSTFWVRIIWYNISDDKFDWVLETSSDGKDWSPTMKAAYNKCKSD